MVHKDLLSSLEVGAYGSCYQVFLGHYFGNGSIEILEETKVTVGKDTHQLALAVNNGHTGDLVLAHKLVSLGNQLVSGQGEGVNDNAVLGALDLIYLVALLFDRHILVDDTNAAFTCNGDSHLSFRYSIHCGSDDRGIKVNIPCKPCSKVDHIGCYIGFCGDKKNIIEGKSFLTELA